MKKIRLLFQAVDVEGNNVALYAHEFEPLDTDDTPLQVDRETPWAAQAIAQAYARAEDDDQAETELAEIGIDRVFVTEVNV